MTDEIVDRFCLVGSVDEHIERLRDLAEAGVDQFNLYLMNGNEEEQLEIYGREIIPALRDVGRPRLRPHGLTMQLPAGAMPGDGVA